MYLLGVVRSHPFNKRRGEILMRSPLLCAVLHSGQLVTRSRVFLTDCYLSTTDNKCVYSDTDTPLGVI